MTIKFRLLNLSAIAPPNGILIRGILEIAYTVAKISARPVISKIYSDKAKRRREAPNVEIICPIATKIKFLSYAFKILYIPEPIFSIKSISLKTLINSLFLGAVTPFYTLIFYEY